MQADFSALPRLPLVFTEGGDGEAESPKISYREKNFFMPCKIFIG